MRQFRLLCALFVSTTSWALLFPRPVVLIVKKKLVYCKRAPLRPKRIASQTIKSLGTTAFVGAVGGAVSLSKFFNRERDIFSPKAGSLQGKTIVITGGSSGLGLESAKRLGSAGANIVLTARTDAKGLEAVRTVQKYIEENIAGDLDNFDQSISYKVLDLDNLKSAKRAEEWDDIPRIDVLMNNAGVMAIPTRELTQDGFERQIQSNHLGHFALTAVLSKKFSYDARIINLSSSAHQMATDGLEFEYLWKAEKGYSPTKSYGQSKLANIYFTRELQRRIDKTGFEWTTACLHPGIVSTDLFRYNEAASGMTRFLPADLVEKFVETNPVIKTVQEGASTQIWLASDADMSKTKAKYCTDRKIRPTGDFTLDDAAAKRLWEESERFAGVEFEL